MKKGPYVLMCGMLIGACDLVPGISGGTMALILGIYEPLMNAISEVKRGSFKNVQFLLLVLGGIIASILCLSSFFHALLQSEARGYLYSLFFGLVLGSAYFVSKKIERWNPKSVLLLLLGGISAWGVTHAPVLISEPSGIIFYLWLALSGSLAVAAMLLPGISGSYIMMILGPYPLVIENLAALSRFQWSALAVLLPVGGGIVLGALFFSKWISFALKHYRANTLSLLLGFMLGAASTIFPFTSLPGWEASTFLSLFMMGLGILAVLGLESKMARSYKLKA